MLRERERREILTFVVSIYEFPPTVFFFTSK